MPDYIIRANFVGLDGKSSARTFDMGTHADETALAVTWDLFKAAYMACCDCLLETASYSSPLNAGVGAANRNVWDAALVNLHLDATGTKTAPIYLPGAADGIFVSTVGVNRNVLDTSDAAVIALAQAYDTYNVKISDGELVDVTAANGVANGRRKIVHVKGL